MAAAEEVSGRVEGMRGAVKTEMEEDSGRKVGEGVGVGEGEHEGGVGEACAPCWS